MPGHARPPLKATRLFCVLGIFLHLSLLASAQAAADSSDALSVRHYIQQLHNANTLNHPEMVSAFYQRHDYQPAWVGLDAEPARADGLVTTLEQANAEGLVFASRYLAGISGLGQSGQPRDLAWLDILYTDAFMSYVEQAGRGQLDPLAFKTSWNYPMPQPDAQGLLETALETNDVAGVLRSLAPKYAGYRRLVDALNFYRAIQQRGGWPRIEPLGTKLEKGQQSDEIILLRRRLEITGDLAMGSDNPVFDTELEEAVRHFQKRHGLEVDGVVGMKTRFALHAPVEKRIQQIVVNLERWRWLPRDLGKRHIRVNMAGFELQAYEDDQPVLSMRVIVGKDTHKTPVFSETMQYLVVNPYWNVPGKISREELIVRERANPGYLARRNIQVVSESSQVLDPGAINWSDYAGVRKLPFRLRQAPGSRNSLGRIKFMMPNKFSVYLHDTPGKRLFNRPVRTFSHGCVRLEEPVRLASYVLGDDWQEEGIQRLIRKGKTRTLKLPEPIPVHMLYQTVWVDGAGNVQFRKDIYNYDRPMMARLPSGITVARTALARSDKPAPVLSLLEDEPEKLLD